MQKEENDLCDRTKTFALRVFRLSVALPKQLPLPRQPVRRLVRQSFSGGGSLGEGGSFSGGGSPPSDASHSQKVRVVWGISRFKFCPQFLEPKPSSL
jgi:hypothetical protein